MSAGFLIDKSITNRSLITGNVRNDESRNATANRPTPPNEYARFCTTWRILVRFMNRGAEPAWTSIHRRSLTDSCGDLLGITTSTRRDKAATKGHEPTTFLPPSYTLLTTNSTNVSKSPLFLSFCYHGGHGNGWHTDCSKFCGRSAGLVRGEY